MASHAHITTTPNVTRRLLATGGVAFLGLAGAATAATAAPHLDAELIAACAKHAELHKACDDDDRIEDLDETQLWADYMSSQGFIARGQPQTMDGMVAKASIAMIIATHRGVVNPENNAAADWAWDLVNDLLRLHGGTVA